MPILKAYHRPTSVSDALHLLARHDVRTMVIAGGTEAIPQLADRADEVVDLQALGLDAIAGDASTLMLGAMAQLQAVVDAEEAPLPLRKAAQREAPNTFRHVATIGGLVAGGDWESELLAALLAYDAQVTVQTLGGAKHIALSDFLAQRSRHLSGAIITQVSVTTDGQAAAERTARTPADKPIVAAVARRTAQGDLRLALAGVAASPILVTPEKLEYLTPPGDFRGSSDYRKHLATVLARRVLSQV